ncbi:MAG: type I DNA topoisomerase [Alphaproteobacteria bacterium]|nr:MAG: type I DNA topoisomerase [Alphaproteobacteria bacterium]
MDVVIVESPSKAKTINKYLGNDFYVLASFGHVRDLPSKDGSVEPDNDFAMKWEIDPASQKRMRDISNAVENADTVYLATDPDREGEAISWHVLEILKEKGSLKDKEVKRVVFNEITKTAVLDAMDNPRDLDTELVDAYLARRALDYLVGFTLSPVLWRKLPGARSAGRVQSVALRIVCERELEIEAFNPREYWTVDADLKTAAGEPFKANLTQLDGNRLDKFDMANEAAAMAAKAVVEASPLSVINVESKPARRNPAAPFTTSTLQQEAARKLGFSASRTMQVAQKLYEGMDIDGETVGLITYMRTDGVTIANEAVQSARDVIAADHGADYVPAQPPTYTVKAKNAQEAHEAIRPTGMERRPGDMSRLLTDEQYRLYELIWKRAVASQMESARFERTTATINTADGKATLRANGSVLTFPGFLALYKESSDDSGSDEKKDDGDRRLPAINNGEATDLTKVNPDQHFTEPPPRYTEASLVKRLEELGIGRPSTYASVLEVLRERNYVHMDRNRFIPDDKGRLVTAFLESFFARYVQYEFTANLEDQLDEVSAGRVNWKTVLQNFWGDFSNAVDATKDLRITEVLDSLNEILGAHVFPAKEDGGDPRGCPKCTEGQLSLKVGKFGAFVGCSNYPECNFTRPLGTNGDNDKAGDVEDTILGIDQDDNILLRSGRFGPYVQRGEGENKDKPKRASIPKDLPLESVDLEQAVALLSLPRDVGTHPESGRIITAAIGRYGPYLRHDGKSGSLASTEEVFTIGINRAVTVLDEAKNKQRRGPAVLKELGVHPDDEQAINVMDGRYGPYVKHNKTNATLPKDLEPDSITLEQAIKLVNAKAAKPKRKKKAAAKKKPAKKKTSVKTNTVAKKKAAPKKAAASGE